MSGRERGKERGITNFLFEEKIAPVPGIIAHYPVCVHLE